MADRSADHYSDASWTDRGRMAAASGIRLGENLWDAATSPLQTAKGIVGLASGTAGNAAALLGLYGLANLIPQEHRDASMAFGDMYAQRYGGLENIKQTLYEDPVGAMADISSFTGVGGAGLGTTSKAAQAAGFGKTATALAQGGRAATAISHVTDPVRLVTRPVTAPINTQRALTRRAQDANVPERLYQQALNPSTGNKNIYNIPKQVKTGLDHGIVVSQEGATRMARDMTNYKKIVDSEIAKGMRQGKYAVPSHVKTTPRGAPQSVRDINTYKALRDKHGNQATPTSDLNKIDLAYDEFETVRRSKGQWDKMPLDEMQELKIQTQAKAKKAYGSQSPMEGEIQKSLARGIRLELERVLGKELSTANAKLSDLMSLQKQLTSTVARLGNRGSGNLLQGVLTAGATYLATSQKTAAFAAFVIRKALDDPAVKSQLAITMHNARRKNSIKFPDIRPIAVISRINEYIANLDEYLAREGPTDEELAALEAHPGL